LTSIHRRLAPQFKADAMTAWTEALMNSYSDYGGTYPIPSEKAAATTSTELAAVVKRLARRQPTMRFHDILAMAHTPLAGRCENGRRSGWA
jgi:hypothetical protein